MKLTNPIKSETVYNNNKLIFETGKIAKQSDSAVWLQYGKIVLLAVVSINAKKKSDFNYVPLSITYLEKDYSKGYISGPFMKRETAQTLPQIINSRLIDRPLRPLFPELYRNETIVDVYLLSGDPAIPQDNMIITAASLALSLSRAPFDVQSAGVRICKTNNEYIVCPDNNSLKKSDFQIFAAGTSSAITMLECEANNTNKNEIIEALDIAHKHIKQLIKLQNEFIAKNQPQSKIIVEPNIDLSEHFKKILNIKKNDISNILQINNNSARKTALENFLAQTDFFLTAENNSCLTGNYQLTDISKHLKYHILRNCVINSLREDGRKTDELRKIECERGLLPSAHGSALFTRGETQSLGIVTLGPERNDSNYSALDKSFFLHYNFPPFSVGDCQRKTSINRREFGHGYLAEKSLKAIMPLTKDFKRNIRIVSEILESNGSSSMASVCSAALALKDAGVPITEFAAGISIGLVSENNQNILLSDIQGAEDHFGDMDFKVAGTGKGITGLQLDIKMNGISIDILLSALNLAEINRFEILGKMEALL